MKNKKIIINICVILSFVIIIGIIASYKLMGDLPKEINASKQFMSKLYSIGAVDTTDKLEDLKYEKVKTINSQNELVNKTIVNQNYGIDLDKHNNVVGFTKRDIKKSDTKISEEEARNRAEQYLSEICGDDLIYEEKKDDDDLPFYSFIYKKKENGYKLYFDEIKININKENGYIDGYSNTTMQKKCNEPEIKITEEDAKNIAYDYFSKYINEIQVEDNFELVYADNRISEEQSNNLELCYLINVQGRSSDGLEGVYKIFINSNTGEIYNSIKDNVESKVLVH
ncbi:MAG: YcdB/YcdC domain-containing protein [Clostridium sp.]